MPVFIETERLYIRPIASTDEEGMFAMDSNPEVHKYLGNRYYKDIAQSRENIEFILQQYKEFGIGRWAVIKKGTNDFVGWTGFKFIASPINKHSNYYDFGYRLAQRFWGKGYATESGKAALDYGIDTLKFKDIYGMTDIDNKASRHILEKLGFQYIETFKYDAEPLWRKEAGEPTTWYKWMSKKTNNK